MPGIVVGVDDPEVARKAIEEIVEQGTNEIGETAPQVTVNVVTGDPAEGQAP